MRVTKGNVHLYIISTCARELKSTLHCFSTFSSLKMILANEVLFLAKNMYKNHSNCLSGLCALIAFLSFSIPEKVTMFCHI